MVLAESTWVPGSVPRWCTRPKSPSQALTGPSVEYRRSSPTRYHYATPTPCNSAASPCKQLELFWSRQASVRHTDGGWGWLHRPFMPYWPFYLLWFIYLLFCLPKSHTSFKFVISLCVSISLSLVYLLLEYCFTLHTFQGCLSSESFAWNFHCSFISHVAFHYVIM